MSYVVKGEQIPPNCDKCDNFAYKSCPANNIPMTEYLYQHRHPDCLYKDIPMPHGKLVDVSKLPVHTIQEYHQTLQRPGAYKKVVYLDDILAAPAILDGELEYAEEEDLC